MAKQASPHLEKAGFRSGVSKKKSDQLQRRWSMCDTKQCLLDTPPYKLPQVKPSRISQEAKKQPECCVAKGWQQWPQNPNCWCVFDDWLFSYSIPLQRPWFYAGFGHLFQPLSLSIKAKMAQKKHKLKKNNNSLYSTKKASKTVHPWKLQRQPDLSFDLFDLKRENKGGKNPLGDHKPAK